MGNRMKVFNKEITEEQAIYLLKCSHSYYIKGHNMFFDWGCELLQQFEALFDKQNYTYSPADLNPEGVRNAVFRIIRKENPKACFYAAKVLEGSVFPNKQFERIILDASDYEAQIAYLAEMPTDRAQEIADRIADSGYPYYNLTLLINCPHVPDNSRNIDLVHQKGTIMQRLYMAKYVPNIDVSALRQDVLKSNHPRANYLFAKYIHDKYITTNGSPHSAHPEGAVNYIHDYYANYNPTHKQIMITQHRQNIIKNRDVQHCYKLAINERANRDIKHSLWDDFSDLQNVILNSEDAEYISKFAIKVKNADAERCIQKLQELGANDKVDETCLCLSMQNFFDDNKHNAR